MAKGLAAVAFLALLALLTVSPACDGGGGPAIDIKDFDTARFTVSQTTTSGGQVGRLTGEGVIDNRRQALSLTYENEQGRPTVAIGRTVYIYDEEGQRWASYTEPTDGQVGFGRPYWPQFWRDAVQIQNLGGESLPTAETTRYLLTFDPERVRKRLQSPDAADELQVLQAEVEVWVDVESQYAVQLTFRLELSYGTTSAATEITSNFSDFGTEVQIEAPEVTTPTPAPTEPAPTEQAPTEPTPTPAGP